MIQKARKIAGYKKNGHIREYDVEDELENLETPGLARKLIMDYATARMIIKVEKRKSPWTDNFGESDDIDLPLLLIEGEVSAQTYWQRERTIEYVLAELNPNKREQEILKKRLDKINAWRALYKKNVGF